MRALLALSLFLAACVSPAEPLTGDQSHLEANYSGPGISGSFAAADANAYAQWQSNGSLRIHAASDNVTLEIRLLAQVETSLIECDPLSLTSDCDFASSLTVGDKTFTGQTGSIDLTHTSNTRIRGRFTLELRDAETRVHTNGSFNLPIHR